MAATRRHFIKSAICAGAGTALAGKAVAATTAPAKRPNILLLFPDQWRFDWASVNGAVPLRTPNIDRIAARGVRFSKAIVATPLCAPSRACLASGLEYEKTHVGGNGVDYPLEQATMYQALRDGGYHVLACGKMDLAKKSNYWGVDGKWRTKEWGFSDAINNAGKGDQIIGLKKFGKPVDPFMTFLNARGLMQEHVDDYAKRGHGYDATFPTPLPDDAYCDNWLGDNGLQLMEQAPKDKPWFLQVNWTGPHNPEDITARMEKTVRGRKMPAVNGEDEYDAATNQLIRQNYSAMCENVDRGIGLYLDKLQAMGQLENTVIIFSSDHGEMLGDHGRWGKQVPYQASACVPLVISAPGMKRSATSDAMVSSIDLTATILDYADLPQLVGRKPIDGRTLRPLLEGKAKAHRAVVYSGLSQWRMITDGRYKVIIGFEEEGKLKKHSGGGRGQSTESASQVLVFDLEKDPAEQNDISDAMPPAAQALLTKLRAGGYTA